MLTFTFSQPVSSPGQAAGSVNLHPYGSHQIEETCSLQVLRSVADHFSTGDSFYVCPAARGNGITERLDACIDSPHPGFRRNNLPIVV